MKPVKIEKNEKANSPRTKKKFPKGAAHGAKDWRIGHKTPVVRYKTMYYTTASEIERAFIEHKPIRYFTVKVSY